MAYEFVDEDLSVVSFTHESQAGLFHEIGRLISETESVVIAMNLNARLYDDEGNVIPEDAVIPEDLETVTEYEAVVTVVYD